MPNSWDFALATIFAVIWPIHGYLDWPNHVKRVAAGDPDARPRMYRSSSLQQWAITAAIVAVTIAFHRSLPAVLGLRWPAGWRQPIGIAVPLAYAVLFVMQVPAIARKPAALSRLRGKLEKDLGALIPTRPHEWNWYWPLAVTAGICEELIFRGYFVWFLTPMLGLGGAAAVSVTICTLAHAYEGVRMLPRVFAVAVVMQALAMVTGSVLPGIALHVLIDLGSGYVTYLAMSAPRPLQAPAPA